MVVSNAPMQSVASATEYPDTLLVEVASNGSVEQKFLVAGAGCRIVFHMLPDPGQSKVSDYILALFSLRPS